MTAPILAPVFLIRVHGREFAARVQLHNKAWYEARDLSFECGRVTVIRVSDGRSVEVAAFDQGHPLQLRTEASA